MRITRIAEPANETGFDVLAEDDPLECALEDGTVAIYLQNGYRIVLSPADALGIAAAALIALLPAGQRPTESAEGLQMRMMWPLSGDLQPR